MLKQLWNALFPHRPPALPRFWYAWLAHPFDDAQHFFIDAENKEMADRHALNRFALMFDRGETVMVEFWPMKEPPKRR